MKKIISILGIAAMFMFVGCQESSTLNGLGDQTKEDGVTVGGSSDESEALEALLAVQGELSYNWVCEYAPADGSKNTILLNFADDGSVSSDTPLSDSTTNLALYSVVDNDGVLTLKFDGPTMFSDYIIDSEYQEKSFVVTSSSSTKVELTGVSSGTEVTLSPADLDDIALLGEKLIWAAFVKQDVLTSILRSSDGRFFARYEIDREQSNVKITWVDTTTEKAHNETLDYELVCDQDSYDVEWSTTDINGVSIEGLSYSMTTEKIVVVGDSTLSFDEPITPNVDFVVGNTYHYYLGGRSMCGSYPAELGCLTQDWFAFIYFYPFSDDIPLEVRMYREDGSTCSENTGYLFVNNYYTDPKSPIYDMDGDWIRFEAHATEFPKDPFGIAGATPAPLYQPAYVKEALEAFTDFYFADGGLYIINDTDDKGRAFYLISADSDLWVRVRGSEISDMN